MIIKDVITSAKYSELSSVSVKNNVEAIVAFINFGMIELYSRFPIKVEEHVINLVTGTPFYDLPSNFISATGAFAEVPADSNSGEKFFEIAINDEDDPFSIFINSWKKVQVPASVTGSFISLLYVAKPEPITLAQAEDGVTELELPDTLVSALMHYIGYKGHLGVKSDAQSENNAQWARFERSCNQAVENGVAFPSDTMSMPDRLADRGFA